MSKGLNVEDPSGMSVSQVTDEELYACLVEMQELPELEEWRGEGERTGGRLSIHKVVSHVFLPDGRKRIKPVRHKGVLPVALSDGDLYLLTMARYDLLNRQIPQALYC